MPLPEFINEEEVLKLKENQAKKRPVFDCITRLIDLVAAICGIIVFSPLLLIVSILIKLSDGGPVFYRQRRLGKYGKRFGIIKFRSMKVNAEFEGARLNMDKNDSRVTKIGKIIRETHIDELPQLFNVFYGQMSLVGPRPALPFHKDYYEEWEMARLDVIPGMTGLSQASGGNALNWDDRILVDVYYVHHRNLLLYFKIIFMTFAQLFVKKGIYNSDGKVKGWTRGIPEWYQQGLPEPETEDKK